MRVRTKSLLWATGLFVAAAVAFATWSFLDSTIRVTVVNRTGYTLNKVKITPPGGSPMTVSLTPGETAYGTIRPKKEGFTQVFADGREVGFATRWWLSVELTESVDPEGVSWFGIRSRTGEFLSWQHSWSRLRTGNHPFRTGLSISRSNESPFRTRATP